MRHWKTLSTEVLAENQWSSYHHDKFETEDGKQGDYYYMKMPVGSVMILPVLNDGRIVMHRQYRYIFDRESLEFPAGGIKIGQTAEQAAALELKEETGYQAGKIEFIKNYAPSNGYFTEEVSLFLATDLISGLANPEAFEEFELVYLTPEEIDQAIRSGEIWGGHSIVLWYFCRQKVVEWIEKKK